MSSLRKELENLYCICDSIKRYKGYKVKPPEETISFIEKAFERIGLKPQYYPKNISVSKRYVPFLSGTAILCTRDEDNILLRCEGKGPTPLLAKASGFAELAERFSGYGLVSGGKIKYYLSLMKQEQIWMEKKKINKLVESTFPRVDIEVYNMLSKNLRKRYDGTAKSICYSLTRNKFFCFPEELVVKLDGSNGMASGNTLEEAIVHAICEYVERLGIIYVLDNLPDHHIDLIDRHDFTNPTVIGLMNAVEDAGFCFEMIDLSSLFGIPLVATIFDSEEWKCSPNPYTKVYCEYPKLIVGADTSPEDAAMRCFTEFFQSAIPIGLAYDLYHQSKNKFHTSGFCLSDYSKLFLMTASPTIVNGNQPLVVNLRKYLKKLRSRKRRKISILDIESLYDVNLKVEIERLVEKLKCAKMEVFVHNITNPVIKFPTVRIFFNGGGGYFSNIPIVGSRYLILHAKNKSHRYSYLLNVVRKLLTGENILQILKEERWWKSKSEYIDRFIEYILTDLSISGIDTPILGKHIEKFYLLGMLHLHKGLYSKAKRCFEASLYMNVNFIPSLISMAYLLKIIDPHGYEKIKDHLKILNIEVDKELTSLGEPTLESNPFMCCNFKCKSKEFPRLCKDCFFAYVSEDIFMKTPLDCIIENYCRSRLSEKI